MLISILKMEVEMYIRKSLFFKEEKMRLVIPFEEKKKWFLIYFS